MSTHAHLVGTSYRACKEPSWRSEGTSSWTSAPAPRTRWRLSPDLSGERWTADGGVVAVEI